MKTGALVLGIIGAFLALPAALCSGVCAAAITQQSGEQVSDSAGGIFLVIGLIAAVLAFASSVMVMVRTRLGAYGLLAAFVLTVITCMSLNVLAFGVALFLFVAMLLAFFAAKEDERLAQGAAPQLAPAYGQPQYGAPPQQGGGGYGGPPPQQGGGGGGFGAPPQQGGGGYGGPPPQNPWQ